MTPCWDFEPPNVATRLSVKRSKSSGATNTCVVSYCGETATAGAGAAWGAPKKLARGMTMAAVGAGKDGQRMDGLLVNDVSGNNIRRALTGGLRFVQNGFGRASRATQ